MSEPYWSVRQNYNHIKRTLLNCKVLFLLKKYPEAQDEIILILIYCD